MGGTASSEPKPKLHLLYKDWVNSASLMQCDEDFKKDIATAIDFDDKMVKIAIYRVQHIGLMMQGSARPRFYLVIKSNKYYWSLDKIEDKGLLLQRCSTEKDAIEKIPGDDRKKHGNITKMKWAMGATGTLGDLITFLEKEINENDFSPSRWAERVFDAWKSGSVEECSFLERIG